MGKKEDEVQKIFGAIDEAMLSDEVLSEENLGKSIGNVTGEKAKELDNRVLDACVKVAVSAYKVLVLMAIKREIKMSNITFQRNEKGGLSISLRIGAVEVDLEDGKKLVLNPTLIGKIESSGGEGEDDEEN